MACLQTSSLRLPLAKKFKENRLSDDDPFGYIAQISAYATKNNRNEAAFLAIDKNSGELAVTRVHELEMIDAPARVRHLKGMVTSEQGHLPVATTIRRMESQATAS